MSEEVQSVEKESLAPSMGLSNGSSGKPELTLEDKEKYFKCFVSDTPYTEDFELFDGKMKVKMRSLLQQETEDIFYQIGLDQKRGLAQTTAFYFAKMSNYRLALSLSEIDGVPFLPTTNRETVPENTDGGLTYVKARADILEKWNSFKLASFYDLLATFEGKMEGLTKAITEKGFWKASA